ncbi:substrate-binding domain-containing protein [Haemophilus paracuniculus]|uniref:substrate-binding domain-containing protein n=1 Tax=Haemophilus paracuniculus TaxID=734 RepID=UPI001300ED90|nr:substrate-binding domain-containing protein [Haemophilus paracuniculus]
MPNDVAVVSLGGLDVGSVSYPRLTAISLPYEQMGKVAGQKLQKILRNEPLAEDERQLYLPIKLVERDSA